MVNGLVIVVVLLSLWESHVHDEDKLEGVVEWEPVGGVDERLDDGEAGVDDPVLFTTQSACTVQRSVSCLIRTVSHW